jgi:hypothetical protein
VLNVPAGRRCPARDRTWVRAHRRDLLGTLTEVATDLLLGDRSAAEARSCSGLGSRSRSAGEHRCRTSRGRARARSREANAGSSPPDARARRVLLGRQQINSVSPARAGGCVRVRRPDRKIVNRCSCRSRRAWARSSSVVDTHRPHQPRCAAHPARPATQRKVTTSSRRAGAASDVRVDTSGAVDSAATTTRKGGATHRAVAPRAGDGARRDAYADEPSRVRPIAARRQATSAVAVLGTRGRPRWMTGG